MVEQEVTTLYPDEVTVLLWQDQFEKSLQRSRLPDELNDIEVVLYTLHALDKILDFLSFAFVAASDTVGLQEDKNRTEFNLKEHIRRLRHYFVVSLRMASLQKQFLYQWGEEEVVGDEAKEGAEDDNAEVVQATDLAESHKNVKNTAPLSYDFIW